MVLFRARCVPVCLPALATLLLLTTAVFAQNASPNSQRTQPTQPAQSQPAEPPSAGTPSFSVNTDEVSLDLVVRTKGGKPILDLKPSDVAVTDNGVPVKLSDLRLVKGASESDHLVTIVFDRMGRGQAQAARSMAAKILNVIPRKGYSYSILQMNGRLRLIQSWTASRDLVNQAIAAATSPELNEKTPDDLSPAEKDLIASVQNDSLSVDFAERARDKMLLTGMEESQRILEDRHDFPSLYALQALANAQRHITGRKLILYFAQDLWADNNSRDTVKSVVGQANRDGVTICAIDTDAMNELAGDKISASQGMAIQNPAGMTQFANNYAAANTTGPARVTAGFGNGPVAQTAAGKNLPAGMVDDMAQNMDNLEFDSFEDTKSPLTSLSSGTGGVFFRAGASMKTPLRMLQESLTTYYEAAYVPAIKDYNGAFRPIAIKPLRKNLVVQSRAGYFAVPPDNGSGIRPFEVPLLTLLAAPTLPTSLAFRSSVLHFGQLPEGNTGALTVEVPVSELGVKEDATTHLSAVHVTIVAQIKNVKGAVVQRFSEDIPRHETPDMLGSDAGQILAMQRHFTAEPGDYTLEAAVFDRISNKAGATRTTFTVAPVASSLSLSDIALVRTVEPLHEEAGSFEPMRYMDGRIVPDLSTELPENTRKLSLFFMVHPIAGAASQPKLEMRIIRNHELLGKMPLELRKVSATGNAIPYLGTIQGRVFPPGKYEIETVLTQDGQTATSIVAFTVEGTIAASNAPAASFTATADTGDRAADQKLTATAAVSNSQFVIASPTNPVPPPSDADVHNIIEGARQRALAWSDSLPNFFCVEVTDHSVDPTGRGDWRHKDTVVQLMRYIEHRESRTTLELNGENNTLNANGAIGALPDELDFAHSVGEFGGMFQVVFEPSAKAKFTWKESDVLDGQPVQVFGFQVAATNSSFDLTGLNNRQHAVGFHGLVYLDPATRSIRRITIDADDIPDILQIHASSISVDYGWISINGHDYLLPMRGAVSLREGKHQAVLNEFEFRNYRRFGSQIHILTKEESKNLPGN
jgi:VWFA-related protein